MWRSQFLSHQPYKGLLLLVYDETKWHLPCGSQNTKNTLKKISSFKNICKNHVLTTRRKKKIQQRQISFCCLPIKRSARLANMKAQLTGGLYNVKILPCCQLCERLIISGWILPPDTVGGYGLIDRKMKLVNVWGEMSTCLQLTSLKCWTAGVFN